MQGGYYRIFTKEGFEYQVYANSIKEAEENGKSLAEMYSETFEKAEKIC